MEVRTINKKDETELINLLEECDKDFIPPITKRATPFSDSLGEITEADISLVSVDNNKILGLISFQNHQEYGPYISWLMVRPGFRNMGVGKLLVANLIGLLKKKSIRSVRIRTHPRNTIAIKLYRSFSFHDSGYEKNAFPKGIPRLYLELKIK